MGTLNFEGRNGAESGPKSLREIIDTIMAPTQNAEIDVNFKKSNLCVFDLGNVGEAGMMSY